MKFYLVSLLVVIKIYSTYGIGEGVVDLNAILGFFKGVANTFVDVNTTDIQVTKMLGKWHQMYKAAVNFDVYQANMYCEVAYFTRNKVLGTDGISIEEAFHINSKNGPINTFKRDLQKVGPGEYWMYTEEYFYPRQFYILKYGPQKFLEDIDTDDETYLVVVDDSIDENERNYTTKRERNVSKSEGNSTKNGINYSKRDRNITKNELYSVKRDRNSTTTELYSTKNSTKNDLNNAKNDLNGAKNEVNGTKNDPNGTKNELYSNKKDRRNGTDNERYEYLVATDNNRLALLVFARDPEEFHKLYEKEVQTALNKQGFGGYVFWNQPIPIYQNSDCYYPSEKEVFVRRSLSNGQKPEQQGNSNQQNLQQLQQNLQPLQQQSPVAVNQQQSQGTSLAGFFNQPQQAPVNQQPLPQQPLNSVAGFLNQPQQLQVPPSVNQVLPQQTQQTLQSLAGFLNQVQQFPAGINQQFLAQQRQLPTLETFLNKPQQIQVPTLAQLQQPGPPVMPIAKQSPLVQPPVQQVQAPLPILQPGQPVLPVVQQPQPASQQQLQSVVPFLQQGQSQQQAPPPPLEPNSNQRSQPLLSHSFQLRLPNFVNPLQQNSPNSFLQLQQIPFIKSYQEIPDFLGFLGAKQVKSE